MSNFLAVPARVCLTLRERQEGDRIEQSFFTPFSNHESRPMLSLTPFLFPSSPDLLLEKITCSGQTLFLTIRSSRRTASCPDCAESAKKVLSQYVRTLADMPLMEYTVRLHVQVRRFVCSNPACGRKTFAEQFPDLTPAYARRTHRQIGRLRAIAKELGGRPGARESTNVCISVSRHTLLRLVDRAPIPPAPAPRVLGVDDWGATRSRMCSCKDSRKEALTWSSASSAEPSLNQERLGQCSRTHKGGLTSVRK
jgi:zinc-finger of transposase IS204/IS1001/IS1096/IS1165